jgi:KAP family P-loop domain
MSESSILKSTLKGAPITPDLKNIWGDDAFQSRENLAKALTNIIRDEPHSLVLGLNGGWGSGKTFILQRWQLQLKKDGFEALYFNAWADDYCGDPLIAIIGQLWEYLKDSDLSECVKSLKASTSSFVKQTVFNALSTVSGGVVTLSEEQLKSAAEKCIDNYSEQNLTREEIRKRLSSLAHKIQEKTHHPLIFIIDELDRCRPTFAIELLERVKHIFDVDNIVFVFGLDRAQLCKSIQAVYGNIDADEYVSRFIDIDFNLPQPNYRIFIEAACKRMNLTDYYFAKDSASRTNVHRDESNMFIQTFTSLAHQLGLSLRAAEHCLRIFFVVMKNVQPKNTVWPELMGLLILIRYKQPELYKQFITGKCDVMPLIDFLNETFLNEQLEYALELKLLKINLYALKTASYEHLQQIAKGATVNNTLLAKHDANMTADVAHSLLEWTKHRHLTAIRSSDRISYLASLIELCQPEIKKPWDRY